MANQRIAAAAVAALVALAVWGPPARGAATEAPGACGSARICGLDKPEDLVRLGGGAGVIASHLGGGGGLDLIEVKTGRVSPIDLAAIPQTPDPAYPCAPLQADGFKSHGLSLKTDGSGRERLYVVRHGAREAVEVFRFATPGRVDGLQWIGCVILPKGFTGNSVTARRDGSFFVTSMTDAGEAPAAAKLARLTAAQPSGGVLEWTPAGGFRPLAIGPVSGPNGLELSADERRLYLTGWTSRAIWAFDLTRPQAAPRRLEVDFMPDNLRWGDGGVLLTAGVQAEPGMLLSCVPASPADRPCATRWRVLALDPARLTRRYEIGSEDHPGFGDVSTALSVNGRLWLGANHGTQAAIIPAPRGH